jgi:TrmH family RNA methyltransferase
MFPVSKLQELSPRTRLRKIARILQGIEVEAAAGNPPDADYLKQMLPQMGTGWPAAVESAAAILLRALEGQDNASHLRAANTLRHALLSALHAEPAEWDLVNPHTGVLDRSSAPEPLAMDVYLEDVRSPFNVGSIFRTAEALGARRILISPRTPLPSHPRAMRTSLGAEAALPWEQAELAAVSSMTGVFALELGGTPIESFAFPRGGIVLVGSEELGLSPEAIRLADSGFGRVSIPLGGAKRSLNVSVAFGILMHAWRRSLTQGTR